MVLDELAANSLWARKETNSECYRLTILMRSDTMGNMIKTFACKETERLINGRFSAKLPQDVQRTAQRKLKQIHGAASLDFLRVPPGNRLEQLSGNRAGQWSIRINDQWRICFVWENGNALAVEIVDYH